jgi:hypothetical protein
MFATGEVVEIDFITDSKIGWEVSSANGIYIFQG